MDWGPCSPGAQSQGYCPGAGEEGLPRGKAGSLGPAPPPRCQRDRERARGQRSQEVAGGRGQGRCPPSAAGARIPFAQAEEDRTHVTCGPDSSGEACGRPCTLRPKAPTKDGLKLNLNYSSDGGQSRPGPVSALTRSAFSFTEPVCLLASMTTCP